jgi:hypothetical protein
MEDGAPKPGGGLGFSLAAKPKRAKVQVQVAERSEERQLITGIEGTRIRAAAPEAPAAGPRVIPSIGNTYKAGVGRGAGGSGGAGGGAGGGGFVPSFVPPSSEDGLNASNTDKFVAAPADDGTKPVVKQYGLQRMGASARAGGGSGASDGAAAGDAPAEPQQQEGGSEQQQAAVPDRGGANGAAPQQQGFNLPGRRGGDKAAFMEELGELPEEMAPEVRDGGGSGRGAGLTRA